MRPRAYLRQLPAANDAAGHALAANGGDVGLLAFLFAVHAVPLVALTAGHSWGTGLVGYATVVTLVTGRELGRELLSSWRARRAEER